jgi:uncharacterized Zn-finger protein
MPDTSPPKLDQTHANPQVGVRDILPPGRLTPEVLPPGATREVIMVDHPVIACDGGDGALGHPRVWLRIVARDVVCPYCSRNYVLNDGVAPDTSH